MAELLYKLGRFSARRAWVVIVSWVLILGAVGSAAVVFSGTLSTAQSIEGLPSQQVADSLSTTFPSASKANAKVVFHTTTGAAFTAAQKSAIAHVLDEVAKLDQLDSIMNPFKVEADKASALKKLASGTEKLEDAPAQFEKAQAKIDDGLAKVNAGEKKILANENKAIAGISQLKPGIAQLEAAIAQLQAVQPPPAGAEQQLAAMSSQLAGLKGQLAQAEAGLAKINEAKAELVTARQKLVDGQQKLDQAKADLPAQAARLAAGQKIADAAANYLVVSGDGQTAVATVIFDKASNKLESAEKTGVVEAFKQFNIEGVQVEFSQELTNSIEGLVGAGEIIGLVVAAVVLFVMLGTLVGAGLPVIAAVLGVGVSAALTMSLSGIVEMTSTTPVLGIMLGLAIGIDYSLFIINRHRRQLKAGMPVNESIAMANGTSGNAVLFAGLTVIIALVALNLTGIGFLALMGDFAAVSIVFGVLVAITFTPAMLKFAGMRILSRRERRRLAEADSVASAADKKVLAAEVEAKLKRPVMATKHPILTLIGTLAVLVMLALPFGSLRLGLADGSNQPADSTQYRAYTLISENFGAGQNGQTVGVATLPEKLDSDDLTSFQAKVAQKLMAIHHVDAVVPAAVSDDGKSVMFAVLPAEGPSAASTERVVRALSALDGYFADKFDATWGVTGMTAINLDMSKKLADALPLYLGVVLLLSMILLVMVFRSLAVPVVASIGFLFTVMATIGVVISVYQFQFLGELFDVHQPGVVMNILPTMLIGILFGLAMDYQLFLVSGMREAYVHGASAREAVNHGVRSGRAVVIAAALIMITVFGGFAFSHLTMVRPIGLGLSVGVLVDAFLVRMLLVPAAMRLLGDAAWWIPKWLDRILPDLDVEGAKLERSHRQ